MSYEPSDYVVEPRQIVAAWAVCAALLAIALSVSIDHTNSDNRSVRVALLPQHDRAGAIDAVTKSSWLSDQPVHSDTGCPDGEKGTPQTSST